MVEELHHELRAALSSVRFSEALRAGVQHTFRQLAEQVYLAAFPPKLAAPIPTSPSQSPPERSSTPDPGKQGAAAALLSSNGRHVVPSSDACKGACEISAASSQTGPSSIQEPCSCQGNATQTPNTTAGQPREPFSVRLSTSLLSLMGLSGGANSGAAATGPTSPSQPRARQLVSPHIQHDPVPIARLLKPVQSAADPLFVDVRQITMVRCEIWDDHVKMLQHTLQL